MYIYICLKYVCLLAVMRTINYMHYIQFIEGLNADKKQL